MSDWRNKPEIDSAAVQALVGAVGESVFRDMSVQFAADLRRLVDTYWAAMDRGERPDAHATAHALKGAAANIGLTRLAAVAAALEQDDNAARDALNAELEVALTRLTEAV
jgi:HPt (histidine-containing phosphotransfer) domain-containing protein